MAQAKTITQYNSFVAGLITEATELTFPANSSYEEENCDLFTQGNRKRRRGIEFEDDYVLSTSSLTDTQLETYAIKTYTWRAVGEEGDTNFLVVQLGNMVYFYDHASDPLSSGIKSFTIDLDNYLAPAATTSTLDKISLSVGKGALIIVSSAIEPLLVVYDSDLDDITVSEIEIRIRDFSGVNDGLEVDEEPSTLSIEHEYNLLNQGWFPTLSGYDPLSVYFSAAGVYPPNSLQWFAAQDSNGNADVNALRKLIVSGSSSAPKGHYIVDPFFIDRSTVSGVAGLPVVSTSNRPVATSSYAGRICYGLNSEVYISQVLTEDRDNAGRCYQSNDPTSSEISDLVDSDGLVVSIPAVGSILALAEVGSVLMVFGNNGVWFISGTDGGFKATDFSVTKLTSLGALSSDSVVSVEDVTVWLSETSIMSIQLDNITGRPSPISLTDNTIKTFYTDLDSTSKANAIGEYDLATKTIRWLYKDNDSAPSGSSPYFYNRALTLDLRLGAFYKYTISNVDGETPFIASVFRTPSLNSSLQSFNVVETDGDQVVDSSSNIVVADLSVTTSQATFVKYLAVVPEVGTSDNNITFALFSNLSFTDWERYDIINYGGSGADYTSFLETGFDLQGDMTREKQSPYIITHCKRTETDFVVVDDEVVYTNPSSLKLQGRWDWSDSGSSGKWSTTQQVYRLKPPKDLGAEYDPGNLLVTARSKIRGRGKCLQLRFTSEQGKDFDLLGWGIVYTGNTNV